LCVIIAKGYWQQQQPQYSIRTKGGLPQGWWVVISRGNAKAMGEKHLTLAWFLVSLIKMQVGNLYTLHVLYMAVACWPTVQKRN